MSTEYWPLDYAMYALIVSANSMYTSSRTGQTICGRLSNNLSIDVTRTVKVLHTAQNIKLEGKGKR
jgi:hypothetical protein